MGTEGLVADLHELDLVLERVAASVPWADRHGNRVSWGGATELDDGLPPGVAELFRHCSRIDASDVGNGWFVHRPRPIAELDGSVPLRIADRGPCFPLGSDGGGGWIVVVESGDVLLLGTGELIDHEYRPAEPRDVTDIAPTVVGFVGRLIGAAREMLGDGSADVPTESWWRGQLAGVECAPATDDEIAQVATDQGVALPAGYASFLRVAGRGCGNLWVGTDAFVPDLFGVRSHAVELLGTSRFALAPTDVVIALHQGYSFLLVSNVEADPPVRRFTEGDAEPVTIAASLSALIRDALNAG